jgi:hypothetical protein
MVLIRALGWLLLALTVAAAVQNGLTWWSEGGFRLLALSDVWGHVDYGSLAALQGYLTADDSSHVWAWGVASLVRLPAIPVFLILGLFSLWIGQPGGEGGGLGEASFVGGSRRSRKRRSRGLT